MTSLAADDRSASGSVSNAIGTASLVWKTIETTSKVVDSRGTKRLRIVYVTIPIV